MRLLMSDLNLGPQLGAQNKDFGAVLPMDFNKSLVSSLVQAQFFSCVVNWSCEKKEKINDMWSCSQVFD